MEKFRQFFYITKMGGGVTIAMTHEGVNFICQPKDPQKKAPSTLDQHVKIKLLIASKVS